MLVQLQSSAAYTGVYIQGGSFTRLTADADYWLGAQLGLLTGTTEHGPVSV